MNTLLNIWFHFLHLIVILFCTLGWMFEPLLFLNLIVLLAVAFSWFILGYFFGFGYCLLTNIHWKFKKAKGQLPTTDSYIKYMVDKVAKVDSNPILVDRVTSLVFFASLLTSIVLNLGLF